MARPIEYTESVARKVLEYRKGGMSIRAIGKQVGITASMVQRILEVANNKEAASG